MIIVANDDTQWLIQAIMVKLTEVMGPPVMAKLGSCNPMNTSFL